MKKLLAVLLSLTMVAMMAISASATIFTYDESDDEYWDEDVNMLDRETYCIVTRDGTVAQGFGRPSGDNLDANVLENLTPGWYEAVWLDTATPDVEDISAVEGKVGLVLRGSSTFTEKTARVRDAGGVAALVLNNYNAGDAGTEDVDPETNEITMSHAYVGMTQTENTVPNVFLTTDIGTKLISEATGKPYSEIIPEILKVCAGETTYTGIPVGGSTYVFIGLISDYNEIGEFSEDKLVPADKALKEGAPSAADIAAPEVEAVDLQMPTDLAVLANDGSSYDTAAAAAAAIGTKPIKDYTYVNGTTGNSNEGAKNLWDDDTTTKFCTSSFPCVSIAKIDAPLAINGIIMATANDNASYNGRSPNEWGLFGSADGVIWNPIAVGDETFFEETDFTYYAAKIDATEPYQYFQFQNYSTTSGTFQVSEVVLCSADAASYPASGESGNIMIGTVIGNETGWDGTEGSGAASAFDGKANTFFDPLGQGDGYCGMQMSETYILEKVAILSRHVDTDYNSRFKGAQIQGSNDGENWTSLWQSDTTGTAPEYYIVTEFENNTGYTMFRYFNDADHGDVAEVEFYGKPGKVDAPAAEEPAAEEPKAEKPATTVEEAVEEVTDNVTEAVENTAEAVGDAVTNAAEQATDAVNNAVESAKSGCGSMIGGGLIVLVTVLGSAWIAKR